MFPLFQNGNRNQQFFGLSFFMTSCDVIREMSILDLVCIERGDTLTIIAWTWYHIRILYIDFFELLKRLNKKGLEGRGFSLLNDS